MWNRCVNCSKPMVCESNLWKIRAIMGGCVMERDAVSTATLSLLGFDSRELVQGSTAAAIYSNVSNILAESVFATLQSLEAIGLSTLLFGCESVALDILRSIASKLDWCNNVCNNNAESALDFETIDGSCDDGCMAKFRLTVSNIENLTSVRSPEFKLGRIIWNLFIFKNYPGLGIYLHGNKKCQTRMTVSLISMNEHTKTIEQIRTHNIEAHGGLCVDNLISWDELIKPENQFIRNNSITIEVEIHGKTCTNAEVRPVKLECGLCLEGIDSQDTSSVPCGHLFCSECIKQSLSECELCPLCETPATISDLRRTVLPL